MSARKAAKGDTRSRLLRAAGEIFAQKGYHAATVADICERAGANISAVNYHFRSKEGLYVEAWSYAFTQSLRAHPPDGGVGADAPAEEQLIGTIRALLQRIADPKNVSFPIAQKEFVNPTGLLRKVMEQNVGPLHQTLLRLVRELIGSRATDRQVEFCTASIISQCLNPLVRLPAGEGYSSEMRRPLFDIDAYITHVIQFSLAGLRAVREGNESAGRSRRAAGRKRQ
ncbi:MAG: CerR family C-terminal domain-containing protein [Bacteroidetes bacterium]|nr:CerR family C-terminal domain-containing protein [Bacteroidota bacterium]